MKKMMCLVLLGMLMIIPRALAQEDGMNSEMKEPMRKNEGWKEHRMHKKGQMGHGMMQGGMGCPMMKMMGEPQMVSVGDGVVILIGNQLIKYDKNLNVVKEVEIKVDMEGMKRMMMEGCPMMGDREEKGEPMDGEKGESPEDKMAEPEGHP